MALSPRSPGLLNIQPTRDSPNKKSPLPRQLSRSASSTSSPFQTDVGTDVAPSVCAVDEYAMSPSKQHRNKKQKFDILDESTIGLPPADAPSFQFRDSSSSINAASIPLPESSPVKTSSHFEHDIGGRDRVMDEDLDTRSVASDDTRFSTFSAVPDMTLFAAMGNRTPARTTRSPRKQDSTVEQTPTGNVFMTPATSRRPPAQSSSSRPGSPTPRQNRKTSREGDTTNLLLDFTQQLEDGGKRAQSPTKSTTEPNLLSFIQSQRNPSPAKAAPRTPGKRNMLNLLDFDLPPQPTPRSIPTITVRELESLKSAYLSEISSLKASLSGREAEVGSLKKAVGDAERRVGEAQESLREERSAREDAEAARSEWEKKGKEVQSLLAKVKEECVNEEREKEELLRKLEESQRARDDAELRAEAANSKATVAQSEVGVDNGDERGDTDAVVASKVAAQLDEKMENLARELHTVYKKKHESKVATLKKTYETRAEKRYHELNQRIEDLMKQNDELQAIKDSSLSIELARNTNSNTTKSDTLQLKAELEEQKATVAGLTREMSSVRETHATLLKDLESERIEKGELVAAVDEMLALQSEVGAPNAMEDFKKSIGVGGSRPSLGSVRSSGVGLENKSSKPSLSASGLPARSDSGKSRMMSNIARMGNPRSAA